MYLNLPWKSCCYLQGVFSFFRPDSKMLFKHLKRELDICWSLEKHLSTSDAWLGENWLQMLSTQNQQPAFPAQRSNNSYSILLKCYTKPVTGWKVNIHFQNNSLTSMRCSEHTKLIWRAPAANCTSHHLQACPAHPVPTPCRKMHLFPLMSFRQVIESAFPEPVMTYSETNLYVTKTSLWKC